MGGGYETKPSLRDTYWALAPRAEIGDEILRHVQLYYEYLNSATYISRYQETYNRYYYGLLTGGQIMGAGKQGELSAVSTNHFRTNLQRLITLITQQELGIEPRAENGDAKAMAQTIFAKPLLEYYLYHSEMRDELFAAVEFAVLWGEAFTELYWDATIGEDSNVDPNTTPEQLDSGQSQVRKTGEPVLTAYHTLEVARDVFNTSPTSDWYCLRRYCNKWTAMAKFAGLMPDGSYQNTELADNIRGQSIEWGALKHTRYMLNRMALAEDKVCIWRFYHRKTPACPDGRIVELLDDGTVLLDGPLPTEKLLLFRMATSDQRDTIFGYSTAEDAKVVQKIIDGYDSTFVTNAAMAGVQNLIVEKGNAPQPSDLYGGGNMVEMNPGGVEPHWMVSPPPQPGMMQQREQAVTEQGDLFAINSTTKGNPPPGVTAAVAIEALKAQTVEFMSNLQRTRAKLFQDVATGLVELFRSFADAPRMMRIAGKNKAPLVRDFVGDDLSGIAYVEVDLGNALSHTTQGRMAIAELVMQNFPGQITPAQFMTLMETGRLDAPFDMAADTEMRIQSENESLMQGQQVPVMLTDTHQLDIPRHASLLSKPEFRTPSPQNQAIMNAVQQHLIQHLQEWQRLDPALAACLNIPWPPPGHPPMMQPPAQGAAPPPPPPGPPPKGHTPPGSAAQKPPGPPAGSPT